MLYSEKKRLLQRIIEDHYEEYQKLKKEFPDDSQIYLDRCGEKIDKCLHHLLISNSSYFLIMGCTINDHYLMAMWTGIPPFPFILQIYKEGDLHKINCPREESVVREYEKYAFLIEQDLFSLNSCN